MKDTNSQQKEKLNKSPHQIINKNAEKILADRNNDGSYCYVSPTSNKRIFDNTINQDGLTYYMLDKYDDIKDDKFAWDYLLDDVFGSIAENPFLSNTINTYNSFDGSAQMAEIGMGLGEIGKSASKLFPWIGAGMNIYVAGNEDQPVFKKRLAYMDILGFLATLASSNPYYAGVTGIANYAGSTIHDKSIEIIDEAIEEFNKNHDVTLDVNNDGFSPIRVARGKIENLAFSKVFKNVRENLDGLPNDRDSKYAPKEGEKFLGDIINDRIFARMKETYNFNSPPEPLDINNDGISASRIFRVKTENPSYNKAFENVNINLDGIPYNRVDKYATKKDEKFGLERISDRIFGVKTESPVFSSSFENVDINLDGISHNSVDKYAPRYKNPSNTIDLYHNNTKAIKNNSSKISYQNGIANHKPLGNKNYSSNKNNLTFNINGSGLSVNQVADELAVKIQTAISNMSN